MTMFHMTNDSDIFHSAEALEADGWRLDGNVYIRGTERVLPLYEAKMAHHFDHRFSTYEGATEAQLNVGTLPRLSGHDHDDPSRVPMPRYWVTQGLDRDASAELHDALFGDQPGRDRVPGVDGRLGQWNESGCSAGATSLAAQMSGR